MDSKKYIGMDVHKESISIAVRNGAGKIVMESLIETKASMILQFIDGLRGDVHVTFEEGTSAAWLYDLLKGGTRGSNEPISAVLHQGRSLDSASTHCFISKNAVSGPRGPLVRLG